jgi:hypothetical protein
MNTINMPGFTAEASLPRERYPSIRREVLRDFDNRSRIVPARSWIGDAICNAASRACFVDDVPGACGVYSSLCGIGGPFA